MNTAFRGPALPHAINLVESRLLIVHASLWPQLAEVRAALVAVAQIVVVGEAPDGDAPACAGRR